jgi:hypothetical protein
MTTQNILNIEKKGAQGGEVGAIVGGIAGGIAGGPEGIEAGAEMGEEIGQAVGDQMVCDVTFSCHGGGIRIYRYTGTDAEAILGGADPASFRGERIL